MLDLPGLHSKFQSHQGYTGRPCLKQNKKTISCFLKFPFMLFFKKNNYINILHNAVTSPWVQFLQLLPLRSHLLTASGDGSNREETRLRASWERPPFGPALRDTHRNQFQDQPEWGKVKEVIKKRSGTGRAPDSSTETHRLGNHWLTQEKGNHPRLVQKSPEKSLLDAVTLQCGDSTIL